LLSEIESYELTEWKVWYVSEHLGDYPDYRADLRMARLASVIAQVNSGKRGRTFRDEDFMPAWTSVEARETQKVDAVAGLRNMMIGLARKGETPTTPKREIVHRPKPTNG